MRRLGARRKHRLAGLLSRSEQWIWPDWPGQSRDHFAMKVAIQPRRCARILVKVLNSAALSAARSASSTRIAASSTPGPVSVCRPSISKSILRREFEQLVVEIRVHAGAQHRIAEEARA